MKYTHLLIVVLSVFFIATSCRAQDDEIINELNPKVFNPNFSEYDAATALYCGQLSEVAYWKPHKIEALYKEIQIAYPEFNIHYEYIYDKSTHSQALLWGNNKFLVIAFRGTEPLKLKDLLTDAKFWNYENNPTQKDTLANMPPGHGGFRKSLMNLITLQSLFPEINSLIKQCSPDADVSEFPIYLTGHSLGAALSQLFIECVDYKKLNFSGAYHFAPPLAVSCSENGYMKEKYGSKIYDIVNYKDYIPRAGRNGVAHFGNFLRICDDNLIYKEPDAYVRFSAKEYFLAFKYHKLASHLCAIRQRDNGLQDIIYRSANVQFPCLGEGIQYIDPCKPLVETNN
jgi:hypothetical protein